MRRALGALAAAALLAVGWWTMRTSDGEAHRAAVSASRATYLAAEARSRSSATIAEKGLVDVVLGGEGVPATL